ncbi:hypothetical protein [Cupriavidus taiwanensis]|uniref:Uncharacterized protein n=1 Tax=Cupriavidus taiwanensis (strain DSM 17343 / BCRC 17206 / CCUG 44338 / CIP 107171 / LMG 19424 / R1) TaxID=977880 RepID=B3R9K4_CUPTR|nr:hypothetical protein [Cupriavidus taiwanensis]CAQ71579.1 hypothetical protein RALTA_B0968 [Cupriavidus taiwanensis LMG 19424]
MKYFDREGRPLTSEEWLEKRADTAYNVVRQFDNGKVYIAIEWYGKCKDREAVYQHLAPLFRLHFQTYSDVDGRLIPDPQDGKMFGTEQEAIEAYEKQVVRRTESTRDDDGNVVEVGNIHTPVSPDAPHSEEAVAMISTGDDDVGVW